MRPPHLDETGSRLDHPEEALAFTAPAGFVRPRDSRVRQTPWSVFQDGSDGSPTSSPPTRSSPRRAKTKSKGGRRARLPSPRQSVPSPSRRLPLPECGKSLGPLETGPDPRRVCNSEAERERSNPAYLPRRAHGRPGAGRGAQPTESAPGGRRRDERDGREIRAALAPAPPARLNPAGRLCGSVRLPLGSFTYS